MIICTNRKHFWQTYQRFSEKSGSLRLQLQKIPRNFVLFEKLIPSEWPSVRVEVSSQNRAQLFFPTEVSFFMPKGQKSKKVEIFLQIPILSRYTRLYTYTAVWQVFLKSLLQKSKYFLLGFLKGGKNENCSEKTSEWYTEDAKCSFDNSAEKHFAKSQNFFCSKSGNVIKKVSFGNFHSHQNKLLFRYVEAVLTTVPNFLRRKREFFSD